MSLRLRLLSAIILIPILTGIVYLGGILYFVFFLGAVCLASWEFFAMAQRAGYKPPAWLGIILVVLLVGNAYARVIDFREIVVLALLVSLIIAIFRHGDGWLIGWSLMIAGALYVGGLGSYLVAVRELPNGLMWTVLALFTTWATDTFAFLAGMLFGRTPFFQNISPKKTREGALGGFGGALVCASVLGTLYALPIAQSLAFGAIVSIASTLGDLAESLIKRQLGTKDSGAIVPGHGGALDRLDSLLFAFVVTYYFAGWFGSSVVR